MCFLKKRDDIRKCSKTHHYCVVGRKGFIKAEVIQMSSKPCDNGALNVAMFSNADPSNQKASYFMRRVRHVRYSSLRERKKGWRLSSSDRWFVRVLFQLHRRRSKRKK